jgi:hypothetical protein
MHWDQAKIGVRFVKHDGISSASRERLGKIDDLVLQYIGQKLKGVLHSCLPL